MSISQVIHSQAIDFIKSQHPFDYLSEDELEQVAQNLESVRFSAGERLLVQGGSPSQHIYIIHEGAVRLARDGKTTQVLEEGELFGYPSMLNKGSVTFDVVAEEDGLAYRISEKIFHELVDNADFAGFFLKSLSERLRRISTGETLSVGGELTIPVGSLVIRPLVSVSPTATVAEAAQVMRRAWVDAALVTDTPPGIITDSDFLARVLAEELGPETPVRQVMSRPLKTRPAETPVYEALFFMLEENIHHLALIQGGQIMGIITAPDLLRHQAKSPLYLMRHLENLEGPVALANYALEIAGTVETLFNGGLDVAQIGRVIATLNDALIRRLLRLAEEELGPPPTPYAWLVFGSEGRMEQALLTDQDNALVYLDDTAEAGDYFKVLTGHVVNNLIQAGFPPCPGGYMATSWHHPLDKWVRLFNSWVTTPTPQALLDTAIFFDFRPVYGDLSVEPLEKIVVGSGKQSIFLAQMARTAIEFRPPLSFFRRIRAEDGQVDLKAGGTAPIVCMARVYALEAQAQTQSTFERLDAAVEAGTLSRGGAATLSETYGFLLKLRLREQLAAIRAGETPTNKIHLQSLSPLENRHLKEAFMAIREMQDAISHRFRTDHLG